MLYGKDYRSPKAFSDPRNIPFWEGLRLLFNRMAEFIINFQDGDEIKRIKSINKLKIATGDSILILLGKYHYLYSLRMRLLKDEWKKNDKLRELFLIEDIEYLLKSYRWKLFPVNYRNFIEEENYVMLNAMVDRVFRHLVEADMKIELDNYGEFEGKYVKSRKLISDYYRSFYGFPLLQNIILLAQRKISMATFAEGLRNQVSFYHRIYSKIPNIFYRLMDCLMKGKEIKLSKNDIEVLDQYKKVIS